MRHAAGTDGIAIIGIGCRLPGKANSPDQFWRLLAEGRDAITDLPQERFNLAELFDSDPSTPGKMYIRRGGFVEGIDQFDAAFFGISPREAVYLDPQHRLLLEVAYEALEDAGVTLERVDKSATGVFVGISTHDYGEIQRYPRNRSLIGSYSNSGTASSIAANRLSYVFGLRGPSFAVDTACSSALTAAHLAYQSLSRGECDLAFLAGAQILLTPEPTIGFCKASMLSPDGRCAAFDAGANGYVRSEGVGVVVLKPLSAALADGDAIYAVIRGTAINQDGRTTGMTVPSSDAQAAMLRSALEQAGIEPSDVDYVEAHGTGTPVGDPIEASAIGEVVGRIRIQRPACVIGSVKTNIGHLEAASGIAGLIKAALAVSHRKIPPSLHCSNPNPAIDFNGLGLRVATSLEDWPQADRLAIAGVNSFGFGGANAHILLQGAPASPPVQEPSRSQRTELLAISARSDDALLATATAYREFLHLRRDLDLSDICGSAALRRTHHSHRAAIIASSHEEMIEALDAMIKSDQRAGVSLGRATGDSPRLAFVFTGMGPQWWGMGHQLVHDEPVFRDALERCDAALRPLTGWSLMELFAAGEAASRMGEPDFAQIANFAIQTALAALWDSWGIVPDAVIGHSAGSIAAAHFAGVYDLADAALLAYHRARLQRQTSGQGGMLAVGLSADDAQEASGAHASVVSLAAINSPVSCTLSGDVAALETIQRSLEHRNIFARILPVTVPYHSVKMEPLRESLLTALQPLRPRSASIRLISDVSGTWSQGSEYDAAYWWQNVRNPVRFADGIATLIDDGVRTFVEIGPHPALAVSINECLAAKHEKGTVLATLRRLEDDRKNMLRSLGALAVQGRPVQWKAVQSRYRKFVRLPTYQWQHERHWFESSGATAAPAWTSSGGHPLLGTRQPGPLPRWNSTIDSGVRLWLDDHVVQSAVVFPAAAYIEMTLSAAASRGTPSVRNLEVPKALFLRPGSQPALQTALDAESNLTIHSNSTVAEDGWTLHARCQIETAAHSVSVVSVADIQARMLCELDPVACYEALKKRGLAYGPKFQGIGQIWQGEKESFGRLDIGNLDLDPSPYKIHPALLDAAFQVFIAATGGDDRQRLMLPVHFDSVTLHGSPGASAWSHARLVRQDAAMLVGDIDILDDNGTPLVAIRGLRCKSIERAATRAEDLSDCLYEFRWEPMPAVAYTRLGEHAALGAAEVGASADTRSAGCGWNRYYGTIEPLLEKLAAQLAADALRALGWNPQPGETVVSSRILQDLRVTPPAERLALCLFAILAEQNILSASRDGWRVVSALPAADPADLRLTVLDTDPAYHTDVDLMLHCGSALATILRGEVDPGEILFGVEGRALVTQFYRDVPGSRFYNKLLADSIAGVVERGSQKPIRILEVGAGTGGSTAQLMTALPMDRVEYIFSDVSPLFTRQAAHEFGSLPGFSTRLFDMEGDPAQQGVAPHSMDIIIAANVLHGTPDLAKTVANLRGLLAPGGVLALLEITRRKRWPDIIFGITSGWWRFQDFDLRPDHPLLEPQQWKVFLLSEGFRDVALIADWDHEGAPGQTVVLAEASTEVETARACGSSPEWLVLSDRGDAGARLANALTERGATVTLSHDLMNGFAGPTDGFRGVIVLSALDAPTAATLTGESLMDAQRLVCDRSLAVLSALQTVRASSPPTLYFVTAGAQSAGGITNVAVAQAPLWGLARAAMREQYDVRCRLADLDEARTTESITALASEMLADRGEEEVAFRAAERWVHRLARPTVDAARAQSVRRKPESEEGWVVQVATPGALSTLAAVASSRREPGLDEVEVHVSAAALNFRDVMLAAGMMPPDAAEDSLGGTGLGLDYAGVVVRCGQNVRDFAPSDEVMGIAHNAFASFVTTSASLVARKPAPLSFTTAAAIPCAFATAHYALEKLARIGRGERVLIHAATGGVGLAAIQIAQHAGAEIFATAGSPDKRAYLESLGIRHVLDSRSLAFADAVLEITNGKGVDITLNSLAGEAIAKGLAILSPYGRFVEIGKRDIYGDSRLGLLPFRKNISFFAVDLDRMCRERPDLAGSILREVLERFESGVYHPIPQHVFPMSEIEGAVRLMAQAKHMGKIVLDTADPNLEITVPRAVVSADGTYLVAGGLRGFGLATVQWLARMGAQSIVLMARSEPSAGAVAVFDSLADHGTRIEIARGDVTRAEDVRRIVRKIRATMPPLRGILHCAAVYDDAPLSEMTPERMRHGMEPKISGAWNLHCETLEDKLDFFVSYSSMASILGNPMQANYCAANEFLDAFAHYRRSLGLPALTVHWGILSDAGHVARTPELAEYLERQGYGSVSTTETLSALEQLLKQDSPNVAVARIDWRKLAGYFPSMVGSTSFRSFAPTEDSQAFAGHQSSSIRVALAQAEDESARLTLLEQYLREKSGKVLGISPQRLDPEKTLTDMGLDSIIAVELVTVLNLELGYELPVVKLLQGLSITQLGAMIAATLPKPVPRTASAAAPLAPIEQPSVLVDAPPVLATPAAHKNGSTPGANGTGHRANGATNGAARHYQNWSRSQKLVRFCARGVLAAATDLQVGGAERFPSKGPFIIASNHLSWLDVPVMLAVVPRPVVVMAAEWLQDSAVTKWLSTDFANAIFVRRGEGDQQALDDGLKVLHSGGILVVSPEGTRSKTGGLADGHTGAAYLAAKAGVPIVPMALWGQEDLVNSWRHLRRAGLNIRFGEPVHVPPDVTSATDLRQHTDHIMHALAALLPDGYRGVYR